MNACMKSERREIVDFQSIGDPWLDIVMQSKLCRFQVTHPVISISSIFRCLQLNFKALQLLSKFKMLGRFQTFMVRPACLDVTSVFGIY